MGLDIITNEEVLDKIREKKISKESKEWAQRSTDRTGKIAKGYFRYFREWSGKEKREIQVGVFSQDNETYGMSKSWRVIELSRGEWLRQTSLKTVYSIIMTIMMLN